MVDSASLVKVVSQGLVAADSAAWTLQGNTRATVVVKAQFSFASGTMEPIAAEEVRRDTDLAFVVDRAEVLFSGLAARGRPEAPSRILVSRGEERLIDRPIDPSGPEALAPGGRIPPFGKVRGQFLGGATVFDLFAPYVPLPDTFDRRYFQSAPVEQQVGALHGGETIRLERLYPGHDVVELVLPQAQVSGHGTVDGRSVPIQFRFDTALVEADQHRCTLLWRGRIAASHRDVLARTQAEVALQVTDPGRLHAEPAWSPEVATAGSSTLESTVVLSSLQGSGQGSGQAAAPPHDLEGTMAIKADPNAAPTLPFHNFRPTVRSKKRKIKIPGAANIPGAPWAGGSTGKSVVSPDAELKQTLGLEPKDRTKAATVEPLRHEPTSAEVARDVEQAEAARRAAEKAEQERAALAAAERRQQEAERFAAEQAAAQQAEAEKARREHERRAEKAEKIRAARYGGFKRKK